jgi:Cu(I)/Ag(I) efflux system membrane fusion protein
MPLVKELLLPGAEKDMIQLNPKAAALADIQTVKVGKSSYQIPSLALTGKVAVDHGRMYTQVASLPGRIEALYAQRPGQWIEKGQPIARIYSKELIAAVEAFRRPNTPESLKLSARNNIRDWQIPEAIFDSLVKSENYRQAIDIYASASGMVSSLEAHVGEQAVNTIMGAPTILYHLVDISKVWIELNVYESQLRHLRKGQQVALEVDAFPGESFSAKVISLSPAISENSRTMTVIASLANPELRLRPGMLARAVLTPSSQTKEQLRIPKSAVLWTGKRSVVFIKDNNFDTPVYRFREIEIGQDLGTDFEVLAGLEPDEELVVNGAFTLDAAAQLKGSYSMMNRPESED